LQNGFPNPNQTEVEQIQQQALGTLPNGAAPPNISADGLNNLRVIALNELFEVAFFTQLLYNVTHNVTGYVVKNSDTKNLLVKTLTAVQAVSEFLFYSCDTFMKYIHTCLHE
jgi:hypothetical protein